MPGIQPSAGGRPGDGPLDGGRGAPVGHVFGYGALWDEAERCSDGSVPIARIRDHVRTWGVAIDNLVSVPGYKYYVEAGSGRRPAVFVTFLDLARSVEAECVGYLFPVGAGDLARLDRRERNYERVEVSRLLTTPAGPGPVWAYFGSERARARHRAAIRTGTAVVQRSYLEEVQAGFAARGLLADYLASTAEPGCPVRDLTRVELSPEE